MVGVSLCSIARAFSAASSASMSAIRMSGGAGELHGEAGVEHVGRGHALVHEARVRPDELGEMGEEGDDVVLGHALDLVDARHVEGDVPGLLPDRLGAFLRDHADLGQRVAGMRLDLEPDAEPRLRLPDLDHRGAGIAGDHRANSLKAARFCRLRDGGAPALRHLRARDHISPPNSRGWTLLLVLAAVRPAAVLAAGALRRTIRDLH